MEKEKLMQKLRIKDYNKELEEILLNKTFSKNIKNLLSSMLYKVENSYEDYKKIKVQVPSRNDLLEELVQIIGNDCKEIEIVIPNSEEKIIPEGKKSITIKEEQKIITYQNELALLKGVYELNTNKFNDESEDLNEKSIFALLNEGEQSSKSEILRDFDGWSWNVMITEIENYVSNLVYQYLVYLLGYDTINQNKNMKIQDLEIILVEKYKQSLSNKLLKNLTKIAILNNIEKNPSEYEVLKNVEKDLQSNLKLMEDKKTYIDEITKQKKNLVKEIEKIDKYINDDLLLKKEYIKQNEKLPQSKRIFSLSDFSDKIQEERGVLEKKIQKLTEKLKPKNYVKDKIKIEEQLEFIKELREGKTIEFVKEFINISLKAINTQIDKMELKREVIDKIYILRYLKQMHVNYQIIAENICKKQFEKTEKKLITKGCNLKALNIFSKDIEENYKIYRNIFNNKIIDLENAYIEIDKENKVSLYDENSLEREEKFAEFKELTVRYNKKTKIFI